MLNSNLNLPIWKSSRLSNRVIAARTRALKVSSDIIKSIPINSTDGKDEDAVELEATINKMLSSGTIKSLEEVYELTENANPNPTQSENEANLNHSGYTVINGSTFLKLRNTDNVEAIRMLYNAQMSLADIRTALSSLKVGDTITLNCGSVIRKYPSQDYESLLKNYPSFRGYKEYITTLDDGVYAVCDTLSGNASTYILYVEQDNNEKAFLSCQKCEFPLSGTLELSIDSVDYQFVVSAESKDELIFQLKGVQSPFEFSWDNGLNISCDKAFKIKNTDLAKQLNIETALYSLKDYIQLGYTGGTIEQEETFYESPFNIKVKRPTNSRSNALKVYKQLIKARVSKSIADSYLNGDSLYTNVQSRSDALKELLAKDKHSNLVQSYTDSLYSEVNVRIVGTSPQVIKKLLAMSDKDLEYLLRYRTDITGIDPYESNEQILAELIRLSENSSGGTYYEKKAVDSDVWKRNTANARTVSVYVEMSKSSKNEHELDSWLDTTYNFLNGVIYALNKNILNESRTYYTDNTLGLNIATTVNMGATYSFAHGLNSFVAVRSEIPTDYIDEFESDMLVIQAYLDAAFSAFSGICAKLAAIINILNSSMALSANTNAGFSLGMGSILQCSLNLGIGLNIPVYLPNLNDLLMKLIEKLEAILNALRDLERQLLCPIQNLLDKYINTERFVLPCKINYDVPVIAGLDGYLGQYLYLLNQLKALLKVTKKDSNWVKYNASMLPGSIELMVINSDACEES